MIFFAGNALQLHSHALLAGLAARAQRRGSTYSIPKGWSTAASVTGRFLGGWDASAEARACIGKGKGAASDWPRDSTSLLYARAAGGLFELVSCPHYFAEIVIYGGLALLVGDSRPLVLLILGWVVRWDGRGGLVLKA